MHPARSREPPAARGPLGRRGPHRGSDPRAQVAGMTPQARRRVTGVVRLRSGSCVEPIQTLLRLPSVPLAMGLGQSHLLIKNPNGNDSSDVSGWRCPPSVPPGGTAPHPSPLTACGFVPETYVPDGNLRVLGS